VERVDPSAEAMLREVVDWRWKGFPPTDGELGVEDIRDQKWNVLRGDLLLPAMVLKESALQHNIDTMARFCRQAGVSLAPHGKTTMAPQIVRRQLAAGAWGVCAATVSQARVFRAFGVPRVLIANEVVEPAAIAWIAGEQHSHADAEILCLVDSVEGVSRMTEALQALRPQRPLPVLLEMGVAGGRAGCRTPRQASEVADAVRRSPFLRLAGVEGFEGIIDGGDVAGALRSVDQYVDEIRAVTESLSAAGSFDGSDEVIVSAGGSAYFDRVVERLAQPWGLDRSIRVVLRSGCYVTHDDGHYERVSPFGSRGGGEPRLRPALEVWGAVLSLPEPGLAIVGLGKRDVPHDLDLPVPRAVQPREQPLRSIEGTLAIVALNDQHAYVRVERGEDVRVGDLIGCGISHPCTAFDKWGLIPVVDDDYTVIDAVRTFF
jgi:D-serine deaminase-like pyridoxal phosphate-dependent protein